MSSHTSATRTVTRTVLALVLVLAAAACGGTEATSSTAAAEVGAAATEAPPTEAAEAAATEATAEEITVVHAQGETTVPVDPETVITFDLGVLDTLDALGIEVDGVPGEITYPERLSHYADGGVETVGTLFEPDHEAVNAMQPDLIIVAARSSTAYADLSEIAPTIDLTVDDADFVNSFVAATTTLGEIFGVQDQVDAALDELQSQVAATSTAAADAGTGLIVLTTGGEVSAYGPGSRFGIIHDVLGVAPAVEDVEAATHGDAISFEFIAEADPDHLFVLDRDAAIGEEAEAAEAILDNEIVAQTTAWSEGQVHHLDTVNWYLLPTGLRSVEEMVGEIAAAVGA